MFRVRNRARSPKGAKFYCVGPANANDPALFGKKKAPVPGRFILLFFNGLRKIRPNQKLYSSDRAVNLSVSSMPTGTSELFLTVYEATSARFPIRLADNLVTDSV